MTALYDIAAQYRADMEKLADLELDDQTLADTLEGMGGELEAKAQNVVFFARNLEATAAAIKEAEAQMAKRRKALENKSARMLAYVLDSMQLAGVTKIECPHFKLAVRDNPPSVDVYEPGLLPAEYMRQPETPPAVPDKTAIAAAIKAGKEVPGAVLKRGQKLAIT
jgi:hypothetical protein